jgi:hypothetical protein
VQQKYANYSGIYILQRNVCNVGDDRRICAGSTTYYDIIKNLTNADEIFFTENIQSPQYEEPTGITQTDHDSCMMVCVRANRNMK